MTTFDGATALRTVKNLCVKGGRTPIQILKQMQSTIRYKNVSKHLVCKLHGRFSNGWTDSLIVDDSHARIKSKIVSMIRKYHNHKMQTSLAVKNVISSDRRKTVSEVAVSRLQQVYCSARFNCRLGFVAHIS